MHSRYPNLSDLEIGLVDDIFSRIVGQLNAYYGTMFEQLVMELVKSKEIEIPFSFNWVGKWWHKDKEIDIAALNENTKEVLFAECKWQEKVNGRKILWELEEKSRYVDWNKGKRREYYAVFAKNFREKFKEKNVLLFDLKDLERGLRQ